MEKVEENQKCKTGLVFHEMYNGRGFSRVTRSWERYGAAIAKMQALGLLAPDLNISENYNNPATSAQSDNFIPVWRPGAASDVQLTTVHSWPYIQYVREMDAKVILTATILPPGRACFGGQRWRWAVQI